MKPTIILALFFVLMAGITDHGVHGLTGGLGMYFNDDGSPKGPLPSWANWDRLDLMDSGSSDNSGSGAGSGDNIGYRQAPNRVL